MEEREREKKKNRTRYSFGKLKKENHCKNGYVLYNTDSIPIIGSPQKSWKMDILLSKWRRRHCHLWGDLRECNSSLSFHGPREKRSWEWQHRDLHLEWWYSREGFRKEIFSKLTMRILEAFLHVYHLKYHLTSKSKKIICFFPVRAYIMSIMSKIFCIILKLNL